MIKVTPIIASTFRSDGGAMFGLVPKPIWSKLIPPNERNGIPQNANSLLLELDNGQVGIVDTGCGPAADYSEKERSINGLGEGWPLLEALREHQLEPGDVDFVVLTHLHWDHGGGLTHQRATGQPALTFPQATHVMHTQEWKDALSGEPLLFKSYPSYVTDTLKSDGADRIKLTTDQDEQVAPGVRLVRTGGHTQGHGAIVIEDSEIILNHHQAKELGPVSRIVFAGDVCPTQHHLRMVFQTAYDTFPLDTRAWKTTELALIAEQGDLLMFTHDPDHFGARIAADPRAEYLVTQALAVLG